MGLWPRDLQGIQAQLRPGLYLLPWHYSAWQVRRFMGLVEALLPDLRYVIEVPAGAPVPRPHSHGVGVAVVLFASAEPYDELRERLTALPFDYIFLRHPEPQDQGYGWIESELKRPVDELLQRVRQDPQHPLQVSRLELLPVEEALSLSENPMEVLELLEEALSAVLVGRVATSAAGYQEALWSEAGRALARRLAALPEDRWAVALEALLEETPQETERYLQGAKALMAVGLAHLIGTSVHLFALAQSLQAPADQARLVLMALLEELPERALSSGAYDRLAARWPAPEMQVTEGLSRALLPEGPRTLRLGLLEDAGLPVDQAVRKVWRAATLLRGSDAADWAEAGALAEEASRIFAEQPEGSGYATCLKLQGDLLWLRGRGAEAVALYDTAQHLFQRIEHPLGVALCLQARAQARDDAGEQEEARQLLWRLGDELGAARSTLALGWRASRRGKPIEAWLRGRHASAVFQAHEAWADEAQAQLLMGWGQHALGRYQSSQEHYLQAVRRFLDLEDAPSARECYARLALVASRLGDDAERQRYEALALK